MAVHDFDRFVEATLEEQSARRVGDILTVDDGGVSKRAVMAWGVVGAEADREAVRCVQRAKRGLLKFLKGGYVG